MRCDLDELAQGVALVDPSVYDQEIEGVLRRVEKHLSELGQSQRLQRLQNERSRMHSQTRNLVVSVTQSFKASQPCE